MRAWRIRHLGPGRIAAVSGAEFQQGDIRIEWNLEYRQKLNSWIALAIFSDMGNIWLWKPEMTQTVFIPSRRPETGVFTKDFYREMAVALGLGLRLDFSFFIFRIDFAMQFYNPSGYRLLNNGRVQYFNYNPLARGLSNWVIGVGYPF
jgi:outer membrane protein assembly factor BamA